MERWRVLAVGYLVWLIALAVVEGAGRQACRMPTARWMAAASDARDRAGREWFRDRARECLDDTRWYAYSMRGLAAGGLVAALGAVWIVRRRSVLVRGGAAAGVMALTLGSIAGVRWLYDWLA